MISIIFLLLLILSVLVFLFLQQRRRLNKLTETLHELQEDQEIATLKSHFNGREKERVRIAKDWHDGIGNSLATFRLLFDTIQTDNQEKHTEALTLLEHTQREFRQIIDNELINSFSTEVAIRDCFKQWQRQFALGNIDLRFKVYNLLEYDKVPMKIKGHLYRMTQELLTNVLKHSAATDIQVELGIVKHSLQLSVEDDGKGLAAAPTLRSIKDRIQILNGRLEVDRTVKKGAKICLFIPLKI